MIHLVSRFTNFLIDWKEITMSKVLKYSKADFVESVHGSGGLIGIVAARLGVDRETIERARQKWSEVSEALEMESEQLLDRAEQVIHEAIKAGDVEVSMWFLEHKGRDRAYGQQIANSNGHQSDGQFGICDTEEI